MFQQTESESEFEATSPFGPGMRLTAEAIPAAEALAGPALWSPFGEDLAGADTEDEAAVMTLFAELEDEAFDEALEALVDEAAGRHLTSTASWSSESEAPSLAANEVEAWMAGLAAEASRMFGELETTFAERTFESLGEGEVEAALAGWVSQPEGPLTSEQQFIGALVKKATKAAGGLSGLAKKGLGVLFPVGKLFGILGKLVRPLLQRVLDKALNKLPPALRGPANDLARRLLGGKAAPVAGSAPTNSAGADASGDGQEPQLGELFDAQLAEAALAFSEGAAEHIVSEAEAEAFGSQEHGEQDPIAALDAARARLARQLAEAPPGEAPLSEIQQFVPVVMAAMKLVRVGIGIIGRDKVVKFLADRLASLIKGFVGQEAANKLSRPIANAGLRMLNLEGEAPGVLGAEALVSTLEDTIRAVAELPSESLAEPLRLSAEVQEAFAEAASRHLPEQFLRTDLDTHETQGEGGVWILMPRATRPCYRYRKFSRVYSVPVTRPLARAILLRNGDSLERRMLDAGARIWPVAAEVHIYEALPGTQRGHLAAFESEWEAGSVGGEASEFEELTADKASLLLGKPGLGTRPGVATTTTASATPIPGQRYFRIVVPGAPCPVHHQRRFVVRLSTAGAQPELRVHLLLSERESHLLGGLLDRRANVQVVALFRRVLGPMARQSLAERLSRRAARAGGLLTAERSSVIAVQVAERMIASVAGQLPGIAPTLAQAARDSRAGATLTFAFTFANAARFQAGDVPSPVLTIRPGHHHG